MNIGTVLDREWIVVLNDGTPVFDWGNGTGVDLMSGETVTLDGTCCSYSIQDSELEMLRRASLVARFDSHKVFVLSLPESLR